jgi:TonB family protein
MTSILAGITVILLGAYGAASVLRRSSAALRHVIWTCAIAATVLLAPLRWRAPQRVITRPLPVVLRSAVSVSGAGTAQSPGLSEIAYSVWALGAALLALRLLLSTARLRRAVREARGVESSCPIPILTSRHVRGPVVAGVLRPVILLPDHTSTWTPSRRRAVLAHELAHIRRRDPAILMAAHLTTIVYWFHPLCWLAAARLRMESERACDDAVLRIGLLPTGYAGHLLGVARKFNPQPAIPMATTSHLESRVKSILDPFVNRSFAARRTWLAAGLLTAACMAPLTTLSLHALQAGASGNIGGSVADASGAVVPGAQVIASSSDAHNTEVTVSRADGSFSFDNIPAGHYSVEARAAGFAPFRLDNLVLTGGGTLRADARLNIGSISEKIRVVAHGTPRPEAPASTGSPTPIRVGGNVQAAKLSRQVKPAYPADLQAQGIEGTVLLAAVISKDGTPLSLSPLNTAVNTEFIAAARDAVSQWRFQPTLLNGEPVEVATTITVEFKLQE